MLQEKIDFKISTKPDLQIIIDDLVFDFIKSFNVSIIDSSDLKLLRESDSPNLRKILEDFEFYNQKLSKENIDIEQLKEISKTTISNFKEYFLSKFDQNQDIKEICETLSENGNFHENIESYANSEDDIISLKNMMSLLMSYLTKIVILSEKSDLTNLEEEKIVNYLTIFPGKPNQIPLACFNGTANRIQESIFALNNNSILQKSLKEIFDEFTIKASKKVAAGNQIHTLPCILFAMFPQGSKDIEKIDPSYFFSEKDIDLFEVIKFSANFNQRLQKIFDDKIEDLWNIYNDQSKENMNRSLFW